MPPGKLVEPGSILTLPITFSPKAEGDQVSFFLIQFTNEEFNFKNLFIKVKIQIVNNYLIINRTILFLTFLPIILKIRIKNENVLKIY